MTILSCQKDSGIQPNQPDGTCIVNNVLAAPDGFEINLLSTVSLSGSLKEIQFVDENTAYLLGTNNLGGYAEAFHSTNGGIDWIDLKIQNRKNPINMFFPDKNIGFITHYGPNGNLLKTTDGGLNWTEYSYPNLNGVLYHIQKDQNNNLYAILFSTYSGVSLVKSADLAESWQVINDSPELSFSLITFSFRLYEDRLYIGGKNGTLIVTDLDGKQLKVLQHGIPRIWDLEVIDHDNLVLAGSSKTLKTSDGGANWLEIYNKSARVIGFSDPEKGIMILNKSYCPGDVYQSNAVFASTENGGVSWKESAQITNLNIRYSDSSIQTGERYIVIIGNGLYELLR